MALYFWHHLYSQKLNRTHGHEHGISCLTIQSGMNRKDFSDWLGIPYRTMQEWELGRRVMPEYVLRLIAYKVLNEKRKGAFG